MSRRIAWCVVHDATLEGSNVEPYCYKWHCGSGPINDMVPLCRFEYRWLVGGVDGIPEEWVSKVKAQIVHYMEDELFLGLEATVDYDWLARAVLESVLDP